MKKALLGSVLALTVASFGASAAVNRHAFNRHLRVI